MIIGPYINAIAIISGALIGASLGGRLPERLRTNLTLIFGLCSMCMGIVMVAKTANMPAMILSILIGTIIGEIILLIFGAMNEGMTGDASILIVKSFLDFFTAMIFATSLGYAVSTIFIPQILLQLVFAYSAVFIIPFVTPEIRADFAATGGVLMIAAGFRICNIQMFHVANMLPALFLAMPISMAWHYFFV